MSEKIELNLEALEAAAKAATAGNWQTGKYGRREIVGSHQVVVDTDYGKMVLLEGNQNFMEQAKADAAYAAAAQPSVVLDLVRQLRELQQDLNDARNGWEAAVEEVRGLDEKVRATEAERASANGRSILLLRSKIEWMERALVAEAAVSAKLSNGFNPSGITALHMDCAGVDIEQLKRLFNGLRTVGQQVLILPLESHLEQLDEAAMRAAGWVRAEKLQEAEKDAARFNVLIEGDVNNLDVADVELKNDPRMCLAIEEIIDRCDQALAKRGDS